MTIGRLIALAALVLPASGCLSQSPSSSLRWQEVDPVFRPLEGISERPDFVLSESAITTIGTTAYVVDLSEWLSRHPVGSTTYVAKLLHEQEHSKRQLHAGTMSWIAHYIVEADFMWAEEQRGWYFEIKHLQARGRTVNVDGVANILNGYKTVTGERMVSFDEARVWVLDVLANRWRP